jgi:hypothetical protein
MAAGDTPGPSGTAEDQYLEDISADELSAEAPADQTDATETLDVSVTESGTNGVGVSETTLLTVKIRQPSHEFTFGVGMSFIPYPLVLTPVV